jgi:hypothetical protein
MIEAFKQGFAFTAGALFAAAVFLMILGAWDLAGEVVKIIRLKKNP